jgi:hypothetical protein
MKQVGRSPDFFFCIIASIFNCSSLFPIKMEAILAPTESKDVSTNKTITVIDEERDLFQTAEVKTVYSKLSVTLMIIFSGLALGSDGFNASIIGNLSLIFGILYPDLSTGMYSRLSNAFIIGMIVGMLGFGYISDRLGRKSGAVLTTALLVLGIVMSAASSGRDELGMFWMLVISRGVAGVGAGGLVKYSHSNSVIIEILT